MGKSSESASSVISIDCVVQSLVLHFAGYHSPICTLLTSSFHWQYQVLLESTSILVLVPTLRPSKPVRPFCLTLNLCFVSVSICISSHRSLYTSGKLSISVTNKCLTVYANTAFKFLLAQRSRLSKVSISPVNITDCRSKAQVFQALNTIHSAIDGSSFCPPNPAVSPILVISIDSHSTPLARRF